MNNPIGLIVLVGLFVTGCTHVNADDALKNLEASQSSIDRQVLELSKNMSESIGGTPKIIQRQYLACGSAPVEALEYNAIAAFTPDDDVTVDAVRARIAAAGWKVTGSTPAQGVSPERLFVTPGGCE